MTVGERSTEALKMLEFRVVEDFTATGVADAGEDVRAGERSFYSVVFSGEARGELGDGAVHDRKVIVNHPRGGGRRSGSGW